MERDAVEAEILVVCAEILMGTATDEKIEKVTALAKANNCMDILKREFLDIHYTLKGR